MHPLASVLSALGIGVADRLAVRRASLRRELDAAGILRPRTALSRRLEPSRARASWPPSAPAPQSRGALLLELRAGDSDISLSVALAPAAKSCAEQFHAEHLRRFGFAAALRAACASRRCASEARCASIDAAGPRDARAGSTAPPLPRTARAWFGAWREVPLVPPERPDRRPAADRRSSSNRTARWCSSPAGRRAPLADGSVLLEDAGDGRGRRLPTAIDPARLEIFNNLFMHIAEQMGEVLRRPRSR